MSMSLLGSLRFDDLKSAYPVISEMLDCGMLINVLHSDFIGSKGDVEAEADKVIAMLQEMKE